MLKSLTLNHFLLKGILIFIFIFLHHFQFFSQSIGVTSPATSGTYCAGTNVSVTYTISGTFTAGNVFTAQLSDAAGSFVASPVSIGTRTATNAGTITGTIPFSAAAGSAYRIRVISSTPAINGSDNGANLTVTAMSLGAPVVPNSSYCQGETTSITYTQSCSFGSGNTYSVQLSDAAGSFSSPTTIGTRSATSSAAITCTIPSGISGSGYRMRIVTSNPAMTSADNGSNITINASTGNPSVYGNGTWNAYCFNAFNNFTSNYQGYFTENNLSFDTRTRFTNTLSPSSATVGAGATGAAYTGCTFGSGTNYSVSYKRTNIPCGLYQIDIVNHDDNAYFYMNGTLVWSHVGWGDSHTNIYTGFISPSDNLEFRYTNGSGPGYLAVNIYTLNPLSMSTPVTICAGSTTTLTATNSSTIPVNYTWLPSSFASPSSGALTTVVNPTTTTVFTLTATDAGTTSCSYSNTINITVNPVPTTTAAATGTYVCSGATTVTLTSGGAASYTWSPATGLNTTNGYSVIANPSVTTVYTVSGSNNCAVVDATVQVTANAQPATPSPTTYGSNVWNVYCYYTSNTYTYTTNNSDYYGYYTENNVAFDSRVRWNSSSSPSAATGGTIGLAYQGCIIGNDYHSTIAKRSGFPCGYYQMDIPYHDDAVTVYVDGAQVYQNTGCCAYRTNIWTGFLGPSSTVDVWVKENQVGSATTFTLVPINYPILSPSATICATSSASITASPYISGATYTWASPNPADLSTTSGTITIATPAASGVYTCTVTDPVTTCSASATTSITLNPLPSTTVSPSTGSINCSAQQYTLTAGGAYTYTWSPSAGLSATTGNTVVANPTVTTTYTVSGSNNCATSDATTTITVVPLVTPTTYPNNKWNVYGYNDLTWTSYYGYYTDNGSGTSGYDFNTSTRWTSGSAPSSANSTNGTSWLGCTMPATNISLSFKRTGFTCNTYTININSNDDNVYLLINGTQVATRAYSSTSVTAWTGPLTPSTTVEFKLTQGSGGSGLNVTFVPASVSASLSTWVGATSTDWFTASNWCGSGVPTSSTDAIIPYAGTLFQPTISGSGATCRTLTISAATASTSVISAVPAATLTFGGAYGLDVYGNWYNNGALVPGTGTVSMLGTGSKTLSTSSTQTFNVLVLNNTGTITIPSGTHKISSNMNFTSGIVNQNGTLHFLNGATATNANNNSYVIGAVVKYGTQSFDFPVGGSGLYRPVSISAPSVSTDNFTAQYYNIDPSPTYTHTSKDATIDHISRCEYWILNRTGGTSNVNVTLTWNTNSCTVDNLSDLIVARWDAGQVKWKDHGNGGTTGNTTSGSVVTSAAVTLFSPFTLASRTANNPLPIELLSFACQLKNAGTVLLKWTTASEMNSDYFSIEKSKDGLNFESIGKVQAAGNSSQVLDYNFEDEFAVRDLSYYRLKSVDKDGSFKYSELCSVSNDHYSNNDGVVFFPNPANTTLTIDLSNSNSQKTNSFKLMDISGKQIDISSVIYNDKIILDVAGLKDGIYFVEIVVNGKKMVDKITVQK